MSIKNLGATVSGAVILYEPGWRQNPHESISERYFSDLAARDDNVRAEVREAIRSANAGEEPLFTRIDSTATVELYNRARNEPRGRANCPLVVSATARYYEEPVPSVGLSLELEIRLATQNSPGLWAHVQCETHEERLLLARRLARLGVLKADLQAAGVAKAVIADSDAVEVAPGEWKIYQICLHDRSVAYDEDRLLGLSRIDSPFRWNHRLTEQLRPLIKELVRRDLEICTPTR